MTYMFERLVVDQRDPLDVKIVFYKSSEMEYGVEWPESRFEMSAADLVNKPAVFVTVVEKTSPQAVDEAVNSLGAYFSRIGETPDYFAALIKAPVDNVVVPFVRKVA